MSNLFFGQINWREWMLLILSFCFLLSIYGWFSLRPSEKLHATFFDVGQGDAILLETPKNLKVLVDGGRDNQIINLLGRHLNWFDKEIEIVIATHDDADHIFGLIEVLKKYQVKVLFTSLPNSKNEIMQELIRVANARGIKIIKIDKPSILSTDDGVLIKFLFPTTDLDNIADGNSASVVTQIVYHDTKILLTGDLGIAGEKYLVKMYGDELQSDILKLGHHGSDTSTSPEFLEKVKPTIAIVSAGKNNVFGHPHQSVLDLLVKFGIEVRQTKEEGSIYFQF